MTALEKATPKCPYVSPISSLWLLGASIAKECAFEVENSNSGDKLELCHNHGLFLGGDANEIVGLGSFLKPNDAPILRVIGLTYANNNQFGDLMMTSQRGLLFGVSRC